MPSRAYWQDYPVTINGANNAPAFDVHGAWISCYAALEEFEISIDGGSRLKFAQGLQIGFEEGRARVQVYAKTGAAIFPNDIVLRVGVGEYKDGRFAVSAPLPIASAQTIRQTPGTNLSGALADVTLVAAAAAVQVIAANPARRCVRITNTHVTGVVRVASLAADVDAGRGEMIQPGEAREFFVTSALFAKSADACTLNFGEEVF